jgi:hypothetical protein
VTWRCGWLLLRPDVDWQKGCRHRGHRGLTHLDWHHASELIWTVARDLDGEDTPATKAWAKTALDYLWTSGPKPVLDWFDAAQPSTRATATRLKRERGYFRSTAHRLQYPSLRERHLPIGSGSVEASAKHLVQHRMKCAVPPF